MSETLLALKTIASEFIAGAEDETIRGRFWLSQLKKEGRIKTGDAKRDSNWLIKVREPVARNHSAGGRVRFQQLDAYESLTIPVAGLKADDSIDFKTMLMNSGSQQIVDIFGGKLEGCVQAVQNALSSQLYADYGGDDDVLIGLGSIMKPDAAVSADDLVAVPSATATYCGKNIGLGTAFGGGWSQELAADLRPSSVALTDWPRGKGSTQYDALTPKMLNAASSKWQTGGNTWAANCEKMIRRGRTFAVATGGSQAVPTTVLLCTEFYDEFLDKLQVRERLTISDYAKSMDFPDTYNYNGAMIVMDYDCPSQKGYALNVSDMELFSIHDKLFYTLGPEFVISEEAQVMSVGFFGNLKFRPKYITEFGYYGS